jgi:hypothetical protein
MCYGYSHVEKVGVSGVTIPARHFDHTKSVEISSRRAKLHSHRTIPSDNLDERDVHLRIQHFERTVLRSDILSVICVAL